MRVILALGSRVFPLSCGKMVSFDACYQDDGTLHSFCGACFLEKHVHLLAYSVSPFPNKMFSRIRIELHHCDKAL